MIPIIISGLILMNKRMMAEVIPPPVRKFWKEWELVLAALTSLTLQIVLILTGNRRKYIRGTLFRVIVWCAYMMADYVATMALGMLSNDLGEIYNNKDHINMGTNALIYDDKGHTNVGTKAYSNEGTELKAFWAPFFLLHLGGPDTITAYSLEDNELFLRHLSGLLVQTILAVYILLLAWTSSHISYLSIVVIVVGCIKCWERTLSLWKASRKNLQNTILADPDPGPTYSKLMEEYSLRDEEGFFVHLETMKDAPVYLDGIVLERTPDNEDYNMVKAHDLFQTFKSLFADLILSFHDRERSQALFMKLTDEEAFNVIEIELGFMYDLLYTKAPVIYTPWGFARRFITVSLTCFAFLSFILDDKLRHKRKLTDFVFTSLLLLVAILLEIYAALVVLASDETRTWLIKHCTAQSSKSSFKERFKCCCLKKKEWFKWFKVQRWSKSMAQYSLLRLSLKEKRCFSIIEELCYKEHIEFTEKYRKLIFDYVQERSKSTPETSIKEFCSQRGKGTLEKYQKQTLEWSVNFEFDESILLWHMATEICYYSEKAPEEVNSSREFSLHMSRYMLYLLVSCPFMLPAGIGFIRFRDTRAEAKEFFKERMPASMDEGTTKRDEGTTRREGTTSRDEGTIHAFLQLLGKKRSSVVKKRRKLACDSLLEVRTDVRPIEVKGDTSKSVLFDACRVASALNANPHLKWNLMKDMWLELLAYAAYRCRGNDHARQLGQGGELLTHVWLLMAHFGLSEQLQIYKGPAVRLVTK